MTVRSNDGTTWQTKLQRIGVKSASSKDVTFNNLGHLINADMLLAAFHSLDGSKAVGMDGMTKEIYARNVSERIATLLKRIRRGTYQPMPSRQVLIPKDDGSKRPLAISCLEDKIVQTVVSKILQAIYEPLFLPCSFGFRPGRNAHDALRALQKATYVNHDGAVVEIDLRQYFNSVPHGPLYEMLARKISDKRFLKLIDVLMTAPVVTDDGVTLDNARGVPQGSIISPVLANIFLHHVVDEWFASISRTHLSGRTHEIRYADDIVFVFEHQSSAQRFYKALPMRLAKFGLEMHGEKSRILRSGKVAAASAHRRGDRLPVYRFLGFDCLWTPARAGDFWRLKFKSRRDRYTEKLKGLRQYLRKYLTAHDTSLVVRRVISGVRGWLSYHAVSDNERAVKGFLAAAQHALLRWFQRRGGRFRSMSDLRVLIRRLGWPDRPKVIRLV